MPLTWLHFTQAKMACKELFKGLSKKYFALAPVLTSWPWAFRTAAASKPSLQLA